MIVSIKHAISNTILKLLITQYMDLSANTTQCPKSILYNKLVLVYLDKLGVQANEFVLENFTKPRFCIIRGPTHSVEQRSLNTR